MPRPIKGVAFNVGLSLMKTDGTLIANPGTLTAKISKDFGDYADIGTTSEEDTTYGQLKLALTNTEMNADVISLYVVDNTTGCIPFTATIYTEEANLAANVIAISGDTTAADNLEAVLDGTGGVALTAKSLTITNDAGTAVTLSSTGNNGRGLYVSGNGTGHGILAQGGATGAGLFGYGGATSGAGIQAQAPTSGQGLSCMGGGGGAGIYTSGNGSAPGINAIAGSTGDGIKATGGSTSGAGINATVGSGNDGDGILAVGAGSGHADINADITGSITGNVSGSVGSVTGAVSCADATAAAASAASADGKLTAGRLGKLDSLTFTTPLKVDATAAIDAAALATELLAEGVSAFDPAADTVAHVTLVDTTTTNTDMRGTDDAATAVALVAVSDVVDAVKLKTDNLPSDPADASVVAGLIGGLNDFDPASDTVAHVTLVDTTTTNTDMRGTDNAATAIALAAAKSVIDAIYVQTTRVYRYFFNKRTHTNSAVVVYADNGTDIDATMAITGDTTTVTKDAPA